MKRPASVSGLTSSARVSSPLPPPSPVSTGELAAALRATRKTHLKLITIPPPYSDAWTPLALSEVEQISDNTKVYKFNFEGDNAANKTAGITVAGVVLVRSPTGEGQVNDDKGKPVIRPYTPISSPDQRGSVDFLVKEYPTGKLTPWLSQLKKGDEILVKGPMTKFEYAPGQFDKALFVAGGSGVTPAYQLISHALENKADQTKWTFLFANVTEKDILMRKEWEQLAAANPDRLKVVYFLDNAPENWTGESGYVTADHIKKHFPREEGDKVRAFVCGPPGQYKAISGAKKGRDQGPVGGALKELGYKEEEVFKY